MSFKTKKAFREYLNTNSDLPNYKQVEKLIFKEGGFIPGNIVAKYVGHEESAYLCWDEHDGEYVLAVFAYPPEPDAPDWDIPTGPVEIRPAA